LIPAALPAPGLSLNPQGGFCLGDYRLKGRRVFRCQVSQGFPINGDSGLVKAGYEPGIRKLLGPAGRVDPYDPELAEIALPVFTIPVGVGKALGNRVLGGFEVRFPPAPIALCQFEYLFAMVFSFAAINSS